MRVRVAFTPGKGLLWLFLSCHVGWRSRKENRGRGRRAVWLSGRRELAALSLPGPGKVLADRGWALYAGSLTKALRAKSRPKSIQLLSWAGDRFLLQYLRLWGHLPSTFFCQRRKKRKLFHSRYCPTQPSFSKEERKETQGSKPGRSEG